MSEWLDSILSRRPGYERQVVERYAQRLLEIARRQLPVSVRRRVDPEDVVQSVYRSFFRRLNEDQFTFADSHDVWRLLATITYCKARHTVQFHQRARRDVRRDKPLDVDNGPDLEVPGCEDLEVLLDCLKHLLAGLPENYRAIVIRRLEGDSIEAISQAVNRSRRTVLRVLAHVQELAIRQLEAEP